MIKVLHVDDDVHFLDATREYLSIHDIDVHGASNATEAIEEIVSGRYDAVVSDHLRPNLNGLELLKSMREKGNDIPFILLTGRSSEDTVIAALNLGADLYLRKGADPGSQFTELANNIKAIVEKRKALDKLFDDQAFYQRLVANLPAVVTRVPLGKAERPYISPGVKNVMGISPEEVMNDPDRYLTGDLRRTFDDVLMNIQKGEDIPPVIHLTVTDDEGTVHWIEQRQILIRDDGGRPQAVETFAFDVTDAKKLADHNSFLSSIISNSLNEIYLLNYDTYVCEFANQKALDDQGCALEELAGTPSFLGEQFTKKNMDRFVEDLRTGKQNMVTVEGSIRRKDGRSQPVEVYVQITEPLGEKKLLVTVFDIDRMKSVERDLQRTEVLLHKYLELTPTAIIILNGQWTPTYVNDAFARIMGLSKEQTYGLDFAVMRDKVIDLDNFLKAFMSSGNQYACGEVRLRTPDGLKILFVSASQVDDDTYIGFGVDITEKKRTEQNLQQLNEKSHLLASITRHDIMNQATVMRGNLELLKIVGSVPEDRLKGMNNAINKIEQYVKFADSFSKTGSLDPKWFDVKDAAVHSWQTIGNKEVNFSVDVPGIEILADPIFPKVFDNLIMNSLLHGTGMGRIDLAMERRGEGLVLIYSDDGPGIPDDIRPRLFNKGAGRNTGLGLFLIKQILHITDISIVENGEDGKGVRFEMTVPAGSWRLKCGSASG
ncbi:MAG: PAS domain S-box protein [Methanomassiliicoccales archaeon]|nr:PAS domain S-box protein [Methanomassiliicoccales archaeon]